MSTLSTNTLFTIAKSWHNASWLYEQLAFASNGDAILLVEDAVLSIHSATTLASFLAKCDMLGVRVYALADDCVLRGIDRQHERITLVDYAGFVELVCAHQKQVAW